MTPLFGWKKWNKALCQAIILITFAFGVKFFFSTILFIEIFFLILSWYFFEKMSCFYFFRCCFFFSWISFANFSTLNLQPVVSGRKLLLNFWTCSQLVSCVPFQIFKFVNKKSSWFKYSLEFFCYTNIN